MMDVTSRMATPVATSKPQLEGSLGRLVRGVFGIDDDDALVLHALANASDAVLKAAAYHLKLGRVLAGKLLQGALALRHFKQAWTLKPSSIVPLHDARRVYWSLGKFDTVQTTLQRTMEGADDATKAELLTYLASHDQSWCEDASNSCLDHRRNRVRHHLLPLLEAEFNPNIVAALARFSTLRREEERWMSALATEQLAACRGPSGALIADRLLALPLAAQRRVVHRWLQSCGLGARRLSQETVAGVLTFAATATGSCRHSLPGHWQILGEYGQLRTEQAPPPHRIPSWEVTLALPGCTMLPLLGLQLTAVAGHGIRRDHDALPGDYPRFATIRHPRPDDLPLTVRTRRPGDRITPCGMQGSRRLKQVWIDLKVPEARRDSMPVVASGDRLVWVPGYGVAAAWAVPAADDDTLALTLEKTPGPTPRDNPDQGTAP